MSKLINLIAIATLTAGLTTSAFARSTDESFEAVQPKGHGPHTVVGAAQEICAGLACTGTQDQPVRSA